MNPLYSLILEIESGVVRGHIVVPRAHTTIDTHKFTTSTLWSATVPISGAPYRDSAHLFSSMIKALSSVLATLAKDTARGGVAERLVSFDCILSSPWITVSSRSVSVAYTKPTIVTKNRVLDIMSIERNKLVRPDMAIVEQKLFDVALNGYSIADFHNKKARELSVFFGIGMSSDIIIKHINEAITGYFSYAKGNITYNSDILLHYASSRDITRDEPSFISAHVHGELTDFFIVQNGRISRITSLPFGYQTLARYVAEQAHEPQHISQSRVTLHAANSLHREEETRTSLHINGVLQDKWSQVFLDTTEDELLPYEVMLNIPKQYYPHFKRALENMLEERKNRRSSKQNDISGSKDTVLNKAQRFIVAHVNTDILHRLFRI